MGNPARIVALLCQQPNIALLQVGEVVKDDKLNLLVKPPFHFTLHLGNLFSCITGGKLSQLFAIPVKVGVEIIKLVESPEEFVKLNTVLAKCHIRPIVKLRIHSIERKNGHQQHQTSDYRKPVFTFFKQIQNNCNSCKRS